MHRGGYYTYEKNSVKSRQFTRNPRVHRAQRREQPYDALRHLKTQTHAMRTESRTNNWFETIARFKIDSENQSAGNDDGVAQYRELVLRTSLTLGTVRNLLPLVDQAHAKLRTTEEHYQLACLCAYIVEFMETQLRFGPICKDSGYGSGQLSADYLSSLLKEPGLNMAAVQPISNGCTYSLIDDLSESIKRSYRDYAAVWLPAMPMPASSWANQVEENLNGNGGTPRAREGVEECLLRLRAMTDVTSVQELYPYCWVEARISQKKTPLTPDTLVGVTGRPLKIFMGKRLYQLISSRYARALSYETPELPLHDFAREHANVCFWPTIGLMKVEMESQARLDMRSDEALHVTNAREQAGLYPKGSFIIREPNAEKTGGNPDDDVAAASTPNMDLMIKQAVQAQIRNIMNTPGGAQKFMKEHGMNKRPKHSAANAPRRPPIEVTLTSEDEGDGNPLRDLQGPSPPVQPAPPIPVQPSYQLHILPSNEGPQFTVSGMPTPAIQFLNPSQLGQLSPLPQDVSVTVANTVSSGSPNKKSNHPVPILPAPPTKQADTGLVESSMKKKKGTDKEKSRSDRSASRSRKCQAAPVAGPSRDSSKEKQSREYPALAQPAHPAEQSATTPVKVANRKKRGVALAPEQIGAVEPPTNQRSMDVRVENNPNSGYSALLAELEEVSKIPQQK